MAIPRTANGWPYLTLDNAVGDDTPAYTQELAQKLNNSEADVAAAINASRTATQAAQTATQAAQTATQAAQTAVAKVGDGASLVVVAGAITAGSWFRLGASALVGFEDSGYVERVSGAVTGVLVIPTTGRYLVTGAARVDSTVDARRQFLIRQVGVGGEEFVQATASSAHGAVSMAAYLQLSAGTRLELVANVPANVNTGHPTRFAIARLEA